METPIYPGCRECDARIAALVRQVAALERPLECRSGSAPEEALQAARTTKRQPASLQQPKLRLRRSTARRNSRSLKLLVGSTPSVTTKVHKAGCTFATVAQKLAADWSLLDCPRLSTPTRIIAVLASGIPG